MADENQYLPVQSADASRQQTTARAFYLLADFFAGSDTMRRMEPGNTGAGILGPGQSALDVGIGQGGEVYLRGRSGQIGSTQNAPAQAMAGPAALLQSPIVLLVLAGAAVWFLMRKA